jgi:hypothetical protein
MSFELRDARGALLTPLKGNRLAGDLPQQILNRDLPRTAAYGHHASMLENWIMLVQSEPALIREFFIEDVYRIEQEGDYRLRVCVAIYEFSVAKEYVSRMDLLPITVTIHLKPSTTPEGASSGAVAAYGAGIALCVAGVVWLAAHWRRPISGDAGLRTGIVLLS